MKNVFLKMAILPWIAAVVFISLLLFFLLMGREVVISRAEGDIDADGRPEQLLIKGRLFSSRGASLQIVWPDNGSITKTWQGLRDDVNPWKAAVADVDGDGRREVLVGAWRRTPFDPVLRNRLFVYEWTGDSLFPIWLGSRLSHPFSDFTVADLDGDGMAELVALETGPESLPVLKVYRWEDFGFTACGQALPVNKEGKLDSLTAEWGDTAVKLSAGSKTLYYRWRNERLEPIDNLPGG